MAVGDVVGHSLDAATLMAQRWTGIRSYILEGHKPAETMNLLNKLLLRFHPHVTATACCAIYDRRNRTCELANAGHPFPRVTTNEKCSFLASDNTRLGLRAAPLQSLAFTLQPGDTLLMYTDGSIGCRDESLDDGFRSTPT